MSPRSCRSSRHDVAHQELALELHGATSSAASAAALVPGTAWRAAAQGANGNGDHTAPPRLARRAVTAGTSRSTACGTPSGP
jgi:hypothetical protein